MFVHRVLFKSYCRSVVAVDLLYWLPRCSTLMTSPVASSCAADVALFQLQNSDTCQLFATVAGFKCFSAATVVPLLRCCWTTLPKYLIVLFLPQKAATKAPALLRSRLSQVRHYVLQNVISQYSSLYLCFLSKRIIILIGIVPYMTVVYSSVCNIT